MKTIIKFLRKTFTPTFMITVILLGSGVLGLRYVNKAWEWALTKKELPLRQSLDNIPGEMGPYKLLHKGKMTAKAEKALNTDRYISWIYRDTSMDTGTPGSGVRVHAAYYSGSQEPVSAIHVPEICYPSQGSKSIGVEQIDVEVPFEVRSVTESDNILVPASSGGEVSLPGKTVPFRQFTYLPTSKEEPESVVYFFVYNGKYVGARNEIALHYLDRSSRYAYYCKVEVIPGKTTKNNDNGYGFRPGVHDKKKTRELSAKFLAFFLPELQKCLPDWQQVLEKENND